MERIINWEQWRMIFATSLSPVLAYLTPTAGFMYALIIMFAFNIWAGMRADGVSVRHCKNFRFSKFKNALAELLLYVTIIYVIYSVMLQCGENRLLMFLCMCICKTHSATLLKHIPQRLRCVLFTTLSGWSLHGYCRDIGNR